MKKLLICIFMMSLIVSCVKEDYFGLSDNALIISMRVSNQADVATINADKQEVVLQMSPGVDISNIEIQTLELSSFAKADKHSGDFINLNDTTQIAIVSESGKTKYWKIYAKIASVEQQLKNSDFNAWHKAQGGYYEPGSGAEGTIWCTGNAGTKLLGIYPTTPLEYVADNYAVHMETLDNGRLSALVGAPISAGSIVTGTFNNDKLDPSNPEAAIEFGTFFSGRPKSFSVKYSYEPGKKNKDKYGKVLEYGDQCDVYAYLEVRENETTKRLATAWFRNGDTQSQLTEIDVEFTYGELDESFPNYMKPDNNTYVSGDSVNYILPTHIVFVGSSSYDGASFAGAVGSILMLDDLHMKY
ncbi:MAG: PCMD domain-containing protein [Bacteroidales bacterium]